MTNHVTLVTKHKLQAGKGPEYENWLSQIMPMTEAYDGYVGINVLRPVDDSNTYTILVRFANADQLNHWLESNERKQMIEQISDMLADGDQHEIKPGAELWFSPPQAQKKSSPHWKRYVLLLAVLIPLNSIVPWLWGSLLPGIEGSLTWELLNDATVAALLVYLFIPALSKWLDSWLHR